MRQDDPAELRKTESFTPRRKHCSLADVKLRSCILSLHHLSRKLATRAEARPSERVDCALIEASGLFDRAWYLAQYSEVARSKLDPILDYLRCGVAKGRNPNPLFESEWYFAQYPDAQATGTNPLIHYLLHGAAEGRDPSPFFDTQWYLAQHPELTSRLRAIERKAFPAALELTQPAEATEAQVSIESESSLVDASSARINPLAHYLQDGHAPSNTAYGFVARRA